jgi:hypothetical protein
MGGWVGQRGEEKILDPTGVRTPIPRPSSPYPVAVFWDMLREVTDDAEERIFPPASRSKICNEMITLWSALARCFLNITSTSKIEAGHSFEALMDLQETV